MKQTLIVCASVLLILSSCKQPEETGIIPGADQTDSYLSYLEGKNVAILLRESSMDDKNPYEFYERREGMEKIFKKEILEGKLIITPIPDIDEVIYGRDVGWKVREIRLDKETESISATKIRENMK